MPTILIRRGDTSSFRCGVTGVLVVAVLACTMLLLMPTLVTAEDAVAPPANVNVCQATTGNCATECLDSTTEVVRTSDATVHCIHAYTTSKAPTDTAADAPPLTSFGAAVAAAAAAVGGIRGSSNQTMDDTNEATTGVVETVAAALAYDGRGIDYYDPVTNIPVTMVWDDIVPCTANEEGQCHHPNYPLTADEEEEAAAETVEEEEEDGADIEAEAEAEAEEEEIEDDEEELATTTTPPTFVPTAMATTPTVAPTATYRPTSFPTTLYSRTDAQDVCLSSSLENDCSECTDTQSVVTTGTPAGDYPTYCVKYAGSTRQDADGGIFYITNQEGGTNLKRFADIPQCAPNDDNQCHTPPDYSNRACTTTLDDCPNLNNSIEYCADSLGLCVPVGTCGEVDDCLNSDNDGQYAMVACDGGTMECQNGYCSMNCNPNESTNATDTKELEEEEEDNDQDNDEEIGPEMGTNTTTLTNTTQSMETTTVATETNITTDTATTTTDPFNNDESREDGSLMTVSYSTNEEEEEDQPLNKTEELEVFFDSMNEQYQKTNTDNTDTTSTTTNTSTLAINQLETSEQYSASSAAVTRTTITLPTCFATTLGVAVVALGSAW